MMIDHSPRSPTAFANGDVSSPESRRTNLPSAWGSAVRGDSEQSASPTVPVQVSSSTAPEQAFRYENTVVERLGSDAQPENSDNNGEGNAAGTRRTAWNKPRNDVVETGSVMGGAISWPALSESTRPVSRSSADLSKPVSDGSGSLSHAPIIPQPPWTQANINSHSTISSSVPTRPRTRNHGGGNGASSKSIGGGPSQKNFSRPTYPPPPPSPPPFPIFSYPRDMIPPVANVVRGTRPIILGGEGSPLHTRNDHSSQWNTSRRGNFGPHPRADGTYHTNHPGRRDQGVHFTPQYGPPPHLGFMPPPLPPPPFMTPPPMRIYSDMASPFIYVPAVLPESHGAMPLVSPPPPPVPFPPTNANHITMLLRTQIDYYFSDVNLVADNFLRSNMDDHGWVPITLIASFPRVHHLTQDIPLIVESLRYSSVVEVQGDKLRKLFDWNKWMNTPNGVNGDSASQSTSDTPENALAKSSQEISLDDAVIFKANDKVVTREVNTDIATGWPLS